jgi:hypothetical protein
MLIGADLSALGGFPAIPMKKIIIIIDPYTLSYARLLPTIYTPGKM